MDDMDLYSWALWRDMLWYAPLFVTSTMVLWLRALKLCSPAALSVGMNLNYFVRTYTVEAGWMDDRLKGVYPLWRAHATTTD